MHCRLNVVEEETEGSKMGVDTVDGCSSSKKKRKKEKKVIFTRSFFFGNMLLFISWRYLIESYSNTII